MDICRFEEQVKKLENKKVYTGKVLFYGSSFIRFWNDEKIEKMLSDMPIGKPVSVNHGFGGATSAELLYYYDRLVKPYLPNALVWCEGGNDMEQGFSPKEAFSYSKDVFTKVKADFPDIKVIILPAIEAPKFINYPEWLKGEREYDKMLIDYASSNINAFYMDILPFLYETGEAGNINKFRNIYRDDRIHLTDDAYDEFSLYFKDKILKVLTDYNP